MEACTPATEDEEARQMVVVHNTFLHVIEEDWARTETRLRRSASDSCISSSTSGSSSSQRVVGKAEREGDVPVDVPVFPQEPKAPLSSHELEAASITTQSSATSSGHRAAAVEESRSLLNRERLVRLLTRVVGIEASVLEVLCDKELLGILPRSPDGEVLSVGSMLHYSARCKPCIFWFQNLCTKSIYCVYCHIAHEGQKKKKIRPSKSTREAREAGKSSGSAYSTLHPSKMSL
eukprot:CAMPEP_0179063002 /NCGR_PEP_ID=MMETSP0796-20121207/27213_1 /TAXON_ID=73915 /ORGANISM="Pyrodinium bahamense, Strain pbaha01" /LENGTH=233 /DNA_ID=CAMNT_0020759915 /DNA_START=57 /DNA_END=758 /DNA_ORIENTATION=-